MTKMLILFEPVLYRNCGVISSWVLLAPMFFCLDLRTVLCFLGICFCNNLLFII